LNRTAPNDFLGGGLGPIPLGSPGAGSLVAFPGETYVTPLFDLTQPLLGFELVPAKPGHIAFPNGTAVWVIEQVTGTQADCLGRRNADDCGDPQCRKQPGSLEHLRQPVITVERERERGSGANDGGRRVSQRFDQHEAFS